MCEDKRKAKWTLWICPFRDFTLLSKLISATVPVSRNTIATVWTTAPDRESPLRAKTAFQRPFNPKWAVFEWRKQLVSTPGLASRRTQWDYINPGRQKQAQSRHARPVFVLPTAERIERLWTVCPWSGKTQTLTWTVCPWRKPAHPA